MQCGRGIEPGVNEVPDLSDGVQLIGGPETGEVVLGEKTDERVVVVLVNGLEGVFLGLFRRG